MNFKASHCKLRNTSCTVGSTLFAVDADGFLHVEGEYLIDLAAIQMLRGHAGFSILPVPEPPVPAPKKKAPTTGRRRKTK